MNADIYVVLNEYKKRFSSEITVEELFNNAVILDTREENDGKIHKIVAHYFIKRLDNIKFDYFVFSEISYCKTDNNGDIEMIYDSEYAVI